GGVASENTAIDPTEEHTFEWVTDEEPTCAETGIKHEECTVCDAVRSEGTEIEATGEHTYEWIIDLDPTCLTDGYKHEECTVCHDKKNENTPIIARGSHDYGEWVVDLAPTKNSEGHKYRECACGDKEEKVLPITLKFNTRTLTLYSNIQVNYKIRKAQLDTSEYKNPYAVFEFEGKNGTRTESVTEPRYEINNGTEYYVFDFSNLAPDQMGNNIAVRLYAEYDGAEYLCDEYATYSVKEYCDGQLRRLENATSSKDVVTRTLIVDILNYGAALQVYNNYKTDALVNSHLTETQKSWGSTTYEPFEKITEQTGTENGFAWNCTSLLLADAVNPTVDFTVSSLEGITIVVKYAGKTVTYEDLKVDGVTLKSTNTENRYKLVTALGAHQMREPITFEAYKDGVLISKTLTTSVESYAFAKSDPATEKYPGLANLVIAMMKYGDSVAAYRG
ncbi:MAG: hypothetical protein IKL40_04340, partial [Clostridia bacterium]|nr:hypothetical protein [Clostridia bacterium]